MNLKKLSQLDRVSLFRFFLGFVDVGSKSFPQARLFKDIVDGIQSYIGSLLNSPPFVPLRKVPHQNSMPAARRLRLRYETSILSLLDSFNLANYYYIFLGGKFPECIVKKTQFHISTFIDIYADLISLLFRSISLICWK